MNYEAKKGALQPTCDPPSNNLPSPNDGGMSRAVSISLQHNSSSTMTPLVTDTEANLHILTPQNDSESRLKSMQVLQSSAHIVETTSANQSSDEMRTSNNQLPAAETLEVDFKQLLLCPLTKVQSRHYIVHKQYMFKHTCSPLVASTRIMHLLRHTNAYLMHTLFA